MNETTHRMLHDWFGAYVRRFEKDGALHPMKTLKLEHSLRVAADARTIAEGLGHDAAGLLLADAAGLLHDVGRFSQFREFQSYCDAETVNHAERGYDVLLAENPLAACEEKERNALLCSVRHHNAKDEPQVLPDAERTLLRIVRDADKLDIFFVVEDAIRNDKLKDFPEMIWRKNMNGPANPVILDGLRTGAMIDYREVKSFIDFQMILLSWMPHISYAPTFTLLQQRRIIPQMRERLPEHPAILEMTDRYEEMVAERAG